MSPPRPAHGARSRACAICALLVGAAAARAADAPAHGPASRVSHGGDHCALSALAFALASDMPAVAARPATVAPMPAAGATTAPAVDPAARWAAQLQHAPPASS